MSGDPWADDPDRTTRREAYMTEAEFFDELDLLAVAYAVDVVRGPEPRP